MNYDATTYTLRCHLSLAQHEYTGYKWDTGVATQPITGSDDKFNYASGGAGYFIDHHATKIIAENMNEEAGIEDMLVGEHLCRQGVTLTPDPRYLAFSSGTHYPSPENDFITGHAHNFQWEQHCQIWKERWEEYLVV